MVGIPILGGFFSKIFFAEAAISGTGWVRVTLLAALALSTLSKRLLLHAHGAWDCTAGPRKALSQNRSYKSRLTAVTLSVCSAIVNLAIGFFAKDIIAFITTGIQSFSLRSS